MLNIPASIEALLKRDTTRKNFRARFLSSPDRNDITNDSVVQESVKYTESVCSRNSFRFGLAECSVLEFETVGVPDLRDELIRCSCEIDTSDLSAAQLAEISGGSYDGELVLAADSDLGFGFYRIPLGDFVVSECPRNHELQEHRKVTAFSAGYDFQIQPVNRAQFRVPIPEAGVTCKLPLEDMALALMAQVGDEPILDAGWTRTEASMSTDTARGSDRWIEVQNVRGETLRIYIYQTSTAYCINAGAIDSVEVDPGKLGSALALLDTRLKTLQVNLSEGARVSDTGRLYELKTIQDLRNLIDSMAFSASGVNLNYHWHVLYPYFVCESGQAAPPSFQVIDFGRSGGFTAYAHPQFFDAEGQSISNNRRAYVVVPVTAAIRVENSTAGYAAQFDFEPGAQASDYVRFFGYSSPGASGQFYNRDLTFSANGDAPGVSSFDGAFSAAGLVNDYLELRGEFAAPSRFGGLRFKTLGDEAPAEISPSDYENFWWDEFSTETIGTIRFSLTEDDQDVSIDYAFGAGLGVYDMTSNEIFRGAGYNLQDAMSLLDQLLIPALQNVRLSAIELSAEGRPDLESGDTLRITDQASRSFDVYLLRRELSGIQILHDEIESVDSSKAGQGGQTYNSGTGQGVTPTDDWIVEEGTTGVWSWAKWRSGRAECHGATEVTINSTTTWTSPISYFGTVVREGFPAGLFHSIESCVPAVSAVEGQTGADFWLSSATGYPKSTTYTQGVYLIRVGNVSNKKVMVEWEAKGRWKA